MARVLFLDRFSILEWSPHGRSWPPRAGPGNAPRQSQECLGTSFGLKDLHGRSRDQFWGNFLARKEVPGTTFDRLRTGLFFAQDLFSARSLPISRIPSNRRFTTFYDWLDLGLAPFGPHLAKCVDLCVAHPPRPWSPVATFSIDIRDQIS